jgi:Uncharacterized protein conserved in bacteria
LAKYASSEGNTPVNIDVVTTQSEEYRLAVASADVALTFLSKLNEDTYTRRSFEIPALNTAQLSEYSADLASLFEENEEIVFFRNPDDLVEKAIKMMSDPAWTMSLAAKGHRRILQDGHDMHSRAQQLIAWIEPALAQRT